MISFPVVNKVRIEPPFGVTAQGKRYSIDRDGEFAAKINVVFSGISIDEAPKITLTPEKRTKAHITISDSYVLTAERDIRAWQSVLAPYQLVEIDFEKSTIQYVAESHEEAERIQLSSLTADYGENNIRGTEDFSIYGRAFLTIAEAYNLLESMSFFIDGKRHLRLRRYVDAYNSFYLFLESNLFLPFKTKDAVRALLASPTFMENLRACTESNLVERKPLCLSMNGAAFGRVDLTMLVKGIVELRGHLRHHTLSNPKRWDPLDQAKHGDDALFLGMVAQGMAMPTFLKTWEEEKLNEFVKQAEDNNFIVAVRVVISVRQAETIRDRAVEMRFPTRHVGPQLAKTVLQNALNLVEEQSPGAEVFAIRATVSKTGQEVFRYDLGPTILR